MANFDATSETQVGRITESRLGRPFQHSDGPLAQWGTKPTTPVNGKWLSSFQCDSARLSNTLGTDRQWYAFNFTACLIKGFCRWDVINDALASESVIPVRAFCDGNGPLAMATLWLNIIRDSVCGCYSEIVLSFDVTRSTQQSTELRMTSRLAPWSILYPQFGSKVCEAQFLHSLWIDSPLSICWGREMQAFPKHPRSVRASLQNQGDQFCFDVRWEDDLVIGGAVGKRFGLRGLVAESIGLLRTQSVAQVFRFLLSDSFDVPIRMPTQTAEQNNVGRDYVGHLWKGHKLSSVQVWPWDERDRIELGNVTHDSGCEPHNGHRLLSVADFKPITVTYMPRTTAFVETA